jgi:hypothetical protein
MLNDTTTAHIVQFQQITNKIIAHYRVGKTSNSTIEDIAIAIKIQLNVNLRKQLSLATTQTHRELINWLVWEIIYSKNIYQIICAIGEGINQFSRKDPQFYHQPENFYHQCCLSLLREIYPSENIIHPAEVIFYSQQLERAVLGYLQAITKIGEAINNAFREYKAWHGAQGLLFNYRNLTHHQSGLALAANIKTQVYQFMIKTDVIGQLTELYHHLSYTPPIWNKYSRFHAHSFNAFLLKHLSEHRYSQYFHGESERVYFTRLNQFHYLDAETILLHRDAVLEQCQKVFSDLQLDPSRFSESDFEVGIRTEEANYRVIVTNENQIILRDFHSALNRFEKNYSNKFVNAKMIFINHNNTFYNNNPGSQSMVDRLRRYTDARSNSFIELLISIGKFIYQARTDVEGVNDFDPFFVSLIKFLYNKPKMSQEEAITQYIYFADVCHSYSLIQNNLYVCADNARREYEQFIKSKGPLFLCRNFTHHSSDVAKTNQFCQQIGNNRNNMVLLLTAFHDAINNSKLSLHSFGAFLVKQLYISPCNQDDFHSQTLEKISMQKTRVIKWLQDAIDYLQVVSLSNFDKARL